MTLRDVALVLGLVIVETALLFPERAIRLVAPVMSFSSGWTLNRQITIADAATALAVLVAIGAAYFAFGQLRVMSRQARSSVFLEIDARFESETMIARRAMLREVVVAVRAEVDAAHPRADGRERERLLECAYAAYVGEWRTTKPGDYEKLFQLPGFFETVGYAARAGYLSVTDVINLLGGSILVTGQVLKPHIDVILKEPNADRRQYESSSGCWQRPRRSRGEARDRYALSLSFGFCSRC